MQLLRLRARIRELNDVRPRCAGCGCDMPIWHQQDKVTAEQMTAPGYEYLPALDFRPGDLVCFWCIVSELDPTSRDCVGHA